MAYKLQLNLEVDRQLSKMDPQLRKRIIMALVRLEALPDPRSTGHALTGPLAGFWTYRVAGDWRAICDIQDQLITISVLDIDHRSAIYR